MAWVDTLTSAVLWIGLIGIGTAGFIVFRFLTQFKHKVIIWHARSGETKQVQIDKFRIIDRPEIKMIQLFKKRKKYPIPPESTISYDMKGNMVTSMILKESDNIEYVKPPTTTSKYEAITTNQRMMLAREIKDANRRGISFLQEHGMTLASMFFVLVVLVLLFAFWGDLFQPLKDIIPQMTRLADALGEAVQRIDASEAGQQLITD